MRLLLPLGLVLFGAITGLLVRALIVRATDRRRGGSARIVALAAGGGAIAGLWLRDVADWTGYGLVGGALLAALAGSAFVAALVSLASPGHRSR